MHEAETESFSTVGEMNPIRVLAASGAEPVVLCVVAIWTRGTMTGHLEEKGRWLRSFWQAALSDLPEAGGCRLLWNSVFLAIPRLGLEQTVERVSRLLQSQQDACLESRCALCETQGGSEHKRDMLDMLQHEVGSDGAGPRDLFVHLRDGRPYSAE